MRSSATALSILLIIVVFTLPAWGATQKKLCPDGEHYLIDIKEISIKYEGTKLQAALSGLASIGGRLTVEPKTLQTAVAATQHWNEFLKGLVAGYNSCAITKKQYQEGLQRIYPQLAKEGGELDKLYKLILEGRKIDEKRLKKSLDSYFANLKNFASLSGQDIIIDRFSAVVESTIRTSEARILAGQSASESRIEETIIKRFDALEQRQKEAPLATPSEVRAEVSEIKKSLLAKAEEAEAAYNKGYLLFDRYRFDEAIPHFRKALSLVKLADFYLALGRAYQEIPNLTQAEQVLREGVATTEESGEERKEASLANQLGITLLAKGDLEGALRYTERALKIFEKSYGTDNPTTRIVRKNYEAMRNKK
jgi:tetratricopeptide (TPR) repeat protein